MNFLIGETYEETKILIYEYVYGAGICKSCGNKVKVLKKLE